MSALAPLLIASYRHLEHSKPGRIYGQCPVLVGPRTYATGRHVWRIVAKAVLRDLDADGNHIAEQLDMVLSANGHERIEYREATAVANQLMGELIDGLSGVIDQHFDLYAMIPKDKMATKRKAVAKRKGKK